MIFDKKYIFISKLIEASIQYTERFSNIAIDAIIIVAIMTIITTTEQLIC